MSVAKDDGWCYGDATDRPLWLSFGGRGRRSSGLGWGGGGGMLWWDGDGILRRNGMGFGLLRLVRCSALSSIADEEEHWFWCWMGLWLQCLGCSRRCHSQWLYGGSMWGWRNWLPVRTKITRDLHSRGRKQYRELLNFALKIWIASLM